MAKRATSTLTDEAAQWFVAMQREPVSPEDRAAFERWIDAAPAHGVAYARVELSWDRADRLKANRHPAPIAAAETPRRWQVSRRAAAAGIATLLAAGGTGWWSLLRAESYETAVGERRNLALADGSRVHLNTATRIEIALGDSRRDIRLIRGEALFEVAKDPARPFIVEAGETSVRAVGTAFNVRVRDALVEVTVTEGVVAIGNGGAGQSASERTAAASDAKVRSPGAAQISAGGGAVASPGAVTEVALDPEALAQRIAWRDGIIQLNGETLEQAVAEFNRYRADPLVVGDPRLAGIRIGGSFEIDESDKFLAALQAGFHIRAVPSQGGAIYLMPGA